MRAHPGVRTLCGRRLHCACLLSSLPDRMSMVDDVLKVSGTDGLRVGDSSTMPRITTGNTMALCVVIGEGAAGSNRASHCLMA
nr:GMC oxidoreductase [Rhizobium mongolense]